ncbi:MAG: response regulator [Vitreoscilla sp.]|nr:response regulator [Vitreoscilla sp.]
MTPSSHSPNTPGPGLFRPKRDLVHRFIAYLLVLSILPMLVLGVASFVIARASLQARAEVHLMQLLGERERYVALQAGQIEDLIANISGVEAITNALAERDHPADNYARLSMQARIGYVLNGYGNLKGLVSIDLITPGGAHYHVGDTLALGAPRREVLATLYNAAAASTRPVHWAGLVDNVNASSRFPQVVTAAKLIRGFRAGTAEPMPLALLLVNYSPEYWRQQFGDASGDGATRVALIDAGGRIMVHPDARRVGNPLPSALRQRLGPESGGFEAQVDGEASMVAYRRASPSGWTLVGFTPLSAANAQAAVIGQATAGVALLCLAVVALAALRFSRRVVTPLRRITDRFKRLRSEPDGPKDHLPVQGEDDIADLTHWFNAFLDGLSERERAEQATRQAEDERHARQVAEAANEAKGLFLAKVSHDLRTPLNAVLGYTQLLEIDGELNERQSQQLEIIRGSGEHLLMLINDILDLSKVEAGKMELHPHEVDLPALLRLVADTLRVKASSKLLGIVLDAAPTLPTQVMCDGKRLRQVLLNLLDNAVKFTDAGEVTFRVRPLPGGHADAAVHVLFEVQDSGVGMTAEELEACFRPFEQVGAVARRSAGTGLGLAISRQLVRLMGGEIQARSAPGEGTCFTFELQMPLAGRSHAGGPSEAPAPVGYHGPRLSVLIVDDVAENRHLITQALASLGFQVHQAADGAEGLDRARTLWPDLILMDTEMPQLGGLQATRELRSLPGLQAVPIITLSANASQADRSQCLAAGANAFLPKPVNLTALTREIGELLGLSWIRPDSSG